MAASYAQGQAAARHTAVTLLSQCTLDTEGFVGEVQM